MVHPFPGPGGVADHPDRGVGVPVLRDDRQCLRELRGAPGAARVVQAQHQIRGGTRPYPLRDHRPRRVQVGQGQVGVVVAQGRAEPGSGGERRGHARYHLDVDVRPGQLQRG